MPRPTKLSVHRDAQARNTEYIGPVKRSRHWSVTINNYTVEEIEKWTKIEGVYLFQEELGEKTSTPHLQGVHSYKHPKTLVQVKKDFPRAHLEVVKNLAAINQYCTKAQTKNGKCYTNNKKFEKFDKRIKYTREDHDKEVKILLDLMEWRMNIDKEVKKIEAEELENYKKNIIEERKIDYRDYYKDII